MSKDTILRAFVAVGLVAVLGLVAVSVYEGRYLEAVAISGLGSIFAWFALVAGKS